MKLMIFIIVLLIIFIIISYFIKNDNNYIMIKPIKGNTSSFSVEQYIKGILVKMNIISSDYFKSLLHPSDKLKVNQNVFDSDNVKKDTMIKPTQNQKAFFKKYNAEQKKIVESDSEFREKFMIDYTKMKNKEITIHDMVDKYKVDSTTIYRRGKRWSK